MRILRRQADRVRPSVPNRDRCARGGRPGGRDGIGDDRDPGRSGGWLD